MAQKLRYTLSGHLFIEPGDDPFAIAAALDAGGYNEDFCLAADFSPGFVGRLMAAGFLVMSLALEEGSGKPPVYLLLPKMHRERSVLFFDDLHESQTVRRLIPRYELRRDFGPSDVETGIPGDFGDILERCARRYGEDWLSPPLREAFLALYRAGGAAAEKDRRQGRKQSGRPPAPPRMVSFGLFRAGRLVAGEFGSVLGRVYTSYSGYHDEDSAGSVQLALTGRWLRDAGFAFWDLGMDIPYKLRLGARLLDRENFLELFRSARIC
jgi:Leu/Phe-tRNA-protein transferase